MTTTGPIANPRAPDSAVVDADPDDGSGGVAADAPLDPPVLGDRPTPAGRAWFPCFEGLRALAAVMVVVHHASSLAGRQRAGVLATPAAVMDSGVAVFFVISGFLIYRPYVAAHLDGRPSLRARSFFWRRLLRLVPAYWLALTFFWYLGNYDLGGDWWRYYLFGQIYSRTTTFGGLVQAWSLCTEVTFYLLVPVWAAALRRLVPNRAASVTPEHQQLRPVQPGGGVPAVVVAQLAACGALYASGFVIRQVISSRNPTWRGLSFQWLPTNVDLFAVGMAMAVVSAWAATDPALRARLDRLAAGGELWWAAGIGLFAWFAWRVGGPTLPMFVDPNGAYRGSYWQQRQFVLGLMTALLLVPVVFGRQDRGPVRWALRSRPVAFVGLVSYGLYLWHFDWMKRVVERTNGFTGEVIWPGWARSVAGDANVVLLLAVGLGIGTVFAAASWYLLERPAERLKRAVG